MRLTVFAVSALLACSGCTHRQLLSSTARQADTLTDLQYRQVLDNLAHFHEHPAVLPHFAVVGAGGTSVNDSGGANAELVWDPRTLIEESLGIEAAREVEEQWTLAPVTDPDKLRAIRCAFQLVAMGAATDLECDELLTAFLGDDYGQWIQRGWYCVGRKKDVPCDACHVGRCGDTYVWVAPGGLEGLSRLTLVTLNIATLNPNPPPAEPMKTVYKHTYIGEKLDTVEVYQRPDPEGAKPTPAKLRSRADFYNPLQSQIQMQGGN